MDDQNGLGANLPFIIEQSIEVAGGMAGRRPVALIAEYPAHLPAISGDTEEFVSVVASLIRLALSWTERGEVRVRARILQPDDASFYRPLPKALVQRLEEGGPWALVSISYTGHPAPDSARAVFDADLSTGGSGPSDLADKDLVRCRAVIKKAGGVLWGEDLADGLPQIHFTLPLQASRAGSAEIPGLRRLVETYLPEDDDPDRTLLLQVDDPDLMEEIERDLIQAGYRVLATDSTSDVHSLARKHPIDLILLDLLAREPSALEVAMVLKQDNRTSGIPVLFLTSVVDPRVGVRMGAVNFLVRPEGTGALIGMIKTVLDSGISPSGRVLVVEPELSTRETIIMMIQNLGYRVTEASGPEEALALAEHVAPQLILVNAKLAQEGDYWLLRSLRQLGENFEIFVVAEAMTEAEGRAAVSRGASGFGETGKLPDLLNEVWQRQSRRD